MSNSEETSIVRKVMLKLCSITGVRIFRNNTGSAWIGASKKFTSKQSVIVESGDVLIKNARFFTAGLCVGSSDLIGFRSIEITHEMIGKKVAVFVAAEIKTEKGKASKEQLLFLKMVDDFGGVSFLATNEIDAYNFVNNKIYK